MQALNVLANAIQKHAAAQEAGAPVKMWYAGTRLKEQAAAAGGFLVELLQMRSLPFSPLSLQAPAAFREACSGMFADLHMLHLSPGQLWPDIAACFCAISRSFVPRVFVPRCLHCSSLTGGMALASVHVCLSLLFATGPTGPRHLVGPDDTFRWCGGQYCQTDLKEALAVLLSPDLRSHQLLAQQWEDPYQRAPWGLLRPHGQLLLDKLAEVSACQVSLLSLCHPSAAAPPSASAAASSKLRSCSAHNVRHAFLMSTPQEAHATVLKVGLVLLRALVTCTIAQALAQPLAQMDSAALNSPCILATVANACSLMHSGSLGAARQPAPQHGS